MKELNNVVKLRRKVRSLQLSISFLKECIFKRISSHFINKRIEKAKVRHNPTLERTFINDVIGKNHTKLQLLCLKLRQSWSSVGKYLSTFDYIRFSRYLADIEQRQRDLIHTKNFRNINWLLNNDSSLFLPTTGTTSVTYPVTNFPAQKNLYWPMD